MGAYYLNYSVKLIKSENYTPTYWSGGMATELITYPEGSSYSNKDFLWRLGVAKINISESTFSSLPKVFRYLIVTEGTINLHHENKYSLTLNDFEQDTFMGDWITKTSGKASVFNLMTKEKYRGELLYLDIPKNKQKTFSYNIAYNKEIIAMCFYAVNGSFKTVLNNKSFEVKTNDLLTINYFSQGAFSKLIFNNASNENSKIIVSIIYS